MRRPRTKLVFLALGLLACLPFAFFRPANEPTYTGRHLSDWLTGYNNGPEARQQTETAVRQIGTNALPCLLEWLSYEEVPLQRRAKTALDNLHINSAVLLPMDRKNLLAEEAMEAFITLGPTAEPAIEDLARLMKDAALPYGSLRAALALPHLGPKAVPSLISVLTNKQSFARPYVVASISSLGTNARPAIPALIECLQDQHLAWQAAKSLGGLRLEPALVVPALMANLRTPNAAAKVEIINALGHFGTNAAPAVPQLFTALRDSRYAVRRAAANALSQIAPETVTNSPAH